MLEVSEEDVCEQPGPAVARCLRGSIISFTEQLELVTGCWWWAMGSGICGRLGDDS